jgi:hypothetical protein
MDKSHQEQRRQSARLETEIREYVQIQGQCRRLFPRAMLVGFLAGAVAVVFRLVLEQGDAWRDWLLGWAHQYSTWGWLLPMLVGALSVGLAVSLVRGVAPEAAGSGHSALESRPRAAALAALADRLTGEVRGRGTQHWQWTRPRTGRADRADG